MNKKVMIISLYFGELPDYFRLWLRSCEWNASIDFLFFSDQQVNELPHNVTLVKSSLEVINKLINKKMGIETVIEKPYKLCDYRPAYGVIFEDWLKDYDYWGHCDIDLVFGDIRTMIEKYSFEKYDKFLPLGHLALYKNSDIVNKYYEQSIGDYPMQDYRDVFTKTKHYGFDEIVGIYQVFLKCNYPIFIKRIYGDISTIHQRFTLSERVYKIIDPSELINVNYPYQTFYWENGKAYRAYYDKSNVYCEELIYIHFRTRNLKIIEENNLSCCDSFYLTKSGIIPKNDLGIPNLKEIKMTNPYLGKFYEWFELIKYNSAKRKDFYIAVFQNKVKKFLVNDKYI